MKTLFTLPFVLCLAVLCSSSSCEETAPQVGTGGATQLTNLGFKIPKNSKGNTVEQQNIADRLLITTSPTKILWNHLIALDGSIIRRMPVRCKITSSGKRLEPRIAEKDGSSNNVNLPRTVGGYFTQELIQPDGTYGSSDAYVYWFDPMGRYHQYGTAGGIGYLLTDYPIDLVDPIDKITGLYKANLAAAEWQATQEAELRKKEGL